MKSLRRRGRSRRSVLPPPANDSDGRQSASGPMSPEEPGTLPKSVPVWSPAFRTQRLIRALRIGVAYLCEGLLSQQAEDCDRYIRSFESAHCDAAVLTDLVNIENLPKEPTKRFYALLQRYDGDMIKNAVFVDFKSFAWSAQHQKNHARLDGSHLNKNFVAGRTGMTDRQVNSCQALIISSPSDPKWIAVVPKAYTTEASMKEGPNKYQGNFLVYYGIIPPSIAHSCPLPPMLSPFIMPITMLGSALDNLAASAENADIAVCNPFTGLTYERHSKWRPVKGYFSDLYPFVSTEFSVRKKLHRAFNACGSLFGFEMINPIFAPITYDVRLDHASGLSVFMEIKVGYFKVSTLPSGAQRFEHEHAHSRANGYGRAFFTFMSHWDYMLTTNTSGTRGYLIKREDWPESFWHKLPPVGESLVHDFPDSSFLDARTIDLGRTLAQIVEDICDIFHVRDATTPPRKATRTMFELLQFAGPCPVEATKLLLGQRLNGLEINDDIPDSGANNDDENDEEDGAAADGNGENIDDEIESLSERDDGHQRSNFTTLADAHRLNIRGGKEMLRDSQLFLLLLNESRTRGQGCPIYLGNNHFMGSIGFIRHIWSATEKNTFDQTGKPPCWVGTLDNATPLVTITQRLTRWRLPKEYAPDEGAPQESVATQNAHPTLVICTSLAREIAHLRDQVWLVPSGILPQAHLGKLKGTNYFRCPLFLKDQMTIDRFAVNIHQLHAEVSKFLSGDQSILIGQDDVQIDPSTYLTTAEYVRRSADVNFHDRILS